MSPRGTLGSCIRLYPPGARAPTPPPPGLHRLRGSHPKPSLALPAPPIFLFSSSKEGLHTPPPLPSTTTTPVSLFPQPPGLNQLRRLANKVRGRVWGRGLGERGPRGRARRRWRGGALCPEGLRLCSLSRRYLHNRPILASLYVNALEIENYGV